MSFVIIVALTLMMFMSLNHWQSVFVDQVVLNPAISKTSKIRVFNNATLVALSRLYVWGSASKTGVSGPKKRPTKHSETVQFTNVCGFLMHFAFILFLFLFIPVVSKDCRANYESFLVIIAALSCLYCCTSECCCCMQF